MLTKNKLDEVYKSILEEDITEGYYAQVPKSVASIEDGKWVLNGRCAPLETLLTVMRHRFEIKATPVSENANREGTTHLQQNEIPVP